MILNKQKNHWEKDYLTLEAIVLIVNLSSIILVGFSSIGFFIGIYIPILFWFSLIFFSFGQFILGVELRAMWFDAIVGSAVRHFYTNIANKYAYIKLIIPDDYNYNLEQLKEFFNFIHNTQQFVTYSTEKRLNYGIGSYECCFDIVIQKDSVEVNLAVSNVNVDYFAKAFSYYLPNIQFQKSTSPFEQLVKNWDDNEGSGGYDCLAGTAMGYTLSNVHHSDLIDLNQDSSNLPTNKLIASIKSKLKTQKVFLQYVITFENSDLKSYFNDEMKTIRQKNYDRFSLRQIMPNNTPEVLQVLLPEIEKNRMNATNNRFKLSTEIVSATIKIMALCSKSEYIETEKLLEQSIKANYRRSNPDQNEIEKIYATSTNQRYCNLSDKPSPHSIPFLNSLYYFPPSWLEPFVSNLYDNIYYYPENKFRRQVIYRRILKRSGQAPWRNKNTILDLDTLVSVFQIPTIK